MQHSMGYYNSSTKSVVNPIQLVTGNCFSNIYALFLHGKATLNSRL